MNVRRFIGFGEPARSIALERQRFTC